MVSSCYLINIYTHISCSSHFVSIEYAHSFNYRIDYLNYNPYVFLCFSLSRSPVTNQSQKYCLCSVFSFLFFCVCIFFFLYIYNFFVNSLTDACFKWHPYVLTMEKIGYLPWYILFGLIMFPPFLIAIKPTSGSYLFIHDSVWILSWLCFCRPSNERNSFKQLSSH